MLPLLLAACTPSPPPNVLLVTMDTTRADAIGAYGQALPTTPNLDALAAAGARFERAYTVTPLTIPAHSSIMTGMYPPRHGVRDNGDFFLGDDAVTLAERLHERGYRTMASIGAEVTSHHWGFSQGFDRYFDDLGAGDERNRWRVERPGRAVVDDALGWLNVQDQAAPWFMWVHLFDAHHPYEPPPEATAAIPGRPYLAEVNEVDRQVGRVLDAIRARGEWDRTVVIAVADHGEGLGDHGEQMHGVLLYDGTTHIPLIVHAPGAEPRVIGAPVSLVDLTPTILAAAGAPPPEHVDGVDLMPVIRGETPDTSRAVYAESLYAWRHYGWSPLRLLVTDDYKLHDTTTPELYARADKREAETLALAKPEIVTALTERLTTLYAGLTPSAGAEKASLDPERVAQLEALGYLAGGGAEMTGDLPRGLPDAVSQLPLLADVESARQALQSGDLATARTKLEAVLAASPGLADPQTLLIQILARDGDRAGALALAEKLDAEHPGSTARSLRASLMLQNGRAADAVELAREAVELDPYLLPAWMTYLHGLILSGDLTVLTEVERAAALLPDSAPIAGILGYVRAVGGRYGEARPLLERALAENNEQPFLHHGIGLVLAAAGESARAEAAFEDEIRILPPAIASRRELVKLYAAQARYEDQLAQLEAIAKVTGPELLTIHSTAQALFNLKRYDDAGRAVADCEALDPSYAPCVMLEANVLSKQGKREAAEAAYHRALTLAGQEPPK